MKVILSVEAVRFPLTGVGRYSYELARGLTSVPVEDLSELRFFSGFRFMSSLPEPSAHANVSHGFRRFVQSSRVLTRAYQWGAPLLRALALGGKREHIYHSPNFFLPPFRGAKIATFHDLSAFKWPQCYDPVKLRFLQQELRKTLESADALITDSEYTRRELAEFSGWPLAKIHAVPLAAAPGFFPREPGEVTSALKRYGLAFKAYSLYVGTIEPRKNLIRLLDAYSRLPLSIRKRWPLVLVGYRGWRSEEIHERIRGAEAEGWAKYLGYVPEPDLPLLFAGARLFAFPSHYEGFGLPVLEAMSSGVPVVCSNSSSLPEVVGSAALMSDPDDVVGLAENLLKGLQDDDWRDGAIGSGLKQAGRFSWSRCVEQTLAVYGTVQ